MGRASMATSVKVAGLVSGSLLLAAMPLAWTFAEPGGRVDPMRATSINGGLATENQLISASGEQRIPPWGLDSRGGSFSPDGSSLAWVRHLIKQGPDEVALWITDENGSREVFRMDKALQLASWSPDGSRVVIAAFNFGMTSSASYAWIVPVDGSGPPVEILKSRSGSLTDVAWSPDGTKIAFTREMRDMFTYDVVSGTIAQLTHGCTWPSPDPSVRGEPDCATYYGFEGAITWSPDGTRLAAVSRKSLVTVDAASGAVSTLHSGKRWLQNALWSPDGQWIAYGVNDKGSFKIRADGGSPIALASTVVSSWQPCPTGTCATLGERRATSRISVKPTLGRRTLIVAGRVQPRDERERWREQVRVEVSIKAASGWRRVKLVKSLNLNDSQFRVSIARPEGEQCRVAVRYAGGWTRTSAKVARPFSC